MLRPAALILVAVAALAAGPAAAAGGSEKEARALFQSAEMSFNLGKFPEALTDYQAAYEAKPLPGFLFNIAQCYRNMGNFERARFFYRRYLALDPHSSHRARVEDLIAEMTRLLDKQEAAAPAPTAAAAALAPTPAISAAPAATPAPVGEPAATLVSAPPAEEAPPARRPIYKRWWFWAAAGAVVAGSVTAAVLLSSGGQPSGTLPPIDGR